MGFLHVIFLLVSILSQQTFAYERFQQRDSSIECFVTYLKQENVDDEYFNNVRVLTFLSEACLRGVEYEKEQLFGQVKSNLQFVDNHDCLSSLDHESYKNLLLKMSVVRQSSEGVMKKLEKMWNGKKTPKQVASERVEKELQDYYESAKMHCNLKIGFQEVFDSFFEIEYEEENFVPYEDVEDFCIKKELSDQQIIDPSKYSIKLYPKNIRVESLDCSKILGPIKANLIASLNDFQSENVKKRKNRCAFKVLKDENDYFHLMLKMELLSKINLKHEQKQEEKKSFVDQMIEISMKIDRNCNKVQL